MDNLLPVARLRKFCVKYNITKLTMTLDDTIYHYIDLGDTFECYRDGDEPKTYRY